MILLWTTFTQALKEHLTESINVEIMQVIKYIKIKWKSAQAALILYHFL